MTSLAVSISPTGITAPAYPDILSEIQARFQAIFGVDIYVAPDSMDGQLLALIAQAIYDENQQVIAAYNSFNPAYATGVGLSSIVKINGISRLVATNSTAVGNVVGVAGVSIVGGVVKDANGNLWNLPAVVTIPLSGMIAVTVTAQVQGAIAAAAGTINIINTPTYGWQSFVSTSDASVGAPIESDAALRARQAVSTGIPALTPLGALYGALANLSGVARLALYENSTGSVDANGLPAHSISAVVSGGNVTDIARTIGQRKTPGAATYGTTSAAYSDPTTGIAYTINYYALSAIVIHVVVNGTALTGWSSSYAADIKAAVTAYINSLAIGEDLQFSRLWAPAYLNGSAEGKTYELTSMTTAKGAGSPGTSDIVIAFNEAATCIVSNVTVNIV